MSISYSDKSVEALRALVAVMENEIATTKPSAQLAAAWGDLVRVLSLGPAPELRTCPRCSGIGMRAASRCGRCWIELKPLGPVEPVAND